MEAQNIINLLNNSAKQSPKFATRKWYAIHYQNGTDYGEGTSGKRYKHSMWDKKYQIKCF